MIVGIVFGFAIYGTVVLVLAAITHWVDLAVKRRVHRVVTALAVPAACVGLVFLIAARPASPEQLLYWYLGLLPGGIIGITGLPGQKSARTAVD